MSFIIFILIGILAGWLAEKIMKRHHGLLVNLGVGVVGALLGGWIAGQLGVAIGGLIGQIVIATGGAVLFLFLLGLVKRN